MGYLFYTISFCVLIAGTALYLTRNRWLHLLPSRPLGPFHDYLYTRLPTSFMSDVESGFTSNSFDLSSNIIDGDQRAGLDQKGKREVEKIMRKRGIGFDEARRVYMEQRFAKNGIGPDGRPLDPKAVSFS